MDPRNAVLGRGKGKSLSPFLPDGSVLWIDTHPTQYQLGDLVTYAGNSTWVCHRLLWKRSEDAVTWYLMKGDGNFFPDGWIPEYRLHGKAQELMKDRPNSKFLTLIWCYLTLAFWFFLCRTPMGSALGKVRSLLIPQPVGERLFAKVRDLSL